MHLVAAQQDPASPLFHQWLTPEEFGAQFGVPRRRIGAGDGVARCAADSQWKRFRQAEAADCVFRNGGRGIRRVSRGDPRIIASTGASHIANSAGPADSSGAGWYGERRHFAARLSPQSADCGAEADSTRSRNIPPGSTHYLFPADFATSLRSRIRCTARGRAGAGISIAIAGRSNINLGDVAAFRTIAGLPANAPDGDCSQASILDWWRTIRMRRRWTWSGAAQLHRQAAVKLVAASSTATTDGVDLAAAYIVNHASAPVVSVSYGSCEQEMGAAELAFYNSLWEQAASEGMSVFVASGDAGAAGCSAATEAAGTGAGGQRDCAARLTATCVGGTEFNEGSSAAQYRGVANTASYGSALGIHSRAGVERELNRWRKRVVVVRRRRERCVRTARMASRGERSGASPTE